MDPKYLNKTNAAGIHITEAAPMDDRMFVNTLASLEALSGVEPFAGIMYDGLVIQVADNRKEYIWIESSSGLMAVGYTYPEYLDDVQGQDYANKTYNLVLYDKVNKISLTFEDEADEGLFIANKELPYHILDDKGLAQVTLKSSSSSFEEIEFPDRVVASTEGITIILDPKPSISESFKITIS